MKRMLKPAIAGTFVSLATVAVSGTANAGVCTAGLMMSVYDATGFSCTLGDMTFSDFSYNGAGTQVADTSVGVTPVSVSGELGFIFNGAWIVSASADDVLIDFTVAETNPTTNPNRLSDALLQILVGTGTFTDLEGLSTGQVLTASDLSPHTVTFSPSTSVNVADDLELSPGANVSQIEKAFSDQVIPEPATLCILGAALGAFGLVRRRKPKTRPICARCSRC